MNKATFIKDLPPSETNATRKLWQIEKPIKCSYNYETDEYQKEAHFVLTSAVVAYSGPETYVFCCDENGKVIDWSEIAGSFQGGLDHEEAIRGFEESEGQYA